MNWSYSLENFGLTQHTLNNSMMSVLSPIPKTFRSNIIQKISMKSDIKETLEFKNKNWLKAMFMGGILFLRLESSGGHG